MDFEQEKLSLTAILFIIGVSCLLFTGIMKVLDDTTLAFFLWAGLLSCTTGFVLFLLRHVGEYLAHTEKRTEKSS